MAAGCTKLTLERGRDANNQPVYGFLHQTFGEYLAALHLAQLVLGGSFILSDYIHRSMWYEPLLLMAGHLSIVSPTHTNALIRDILDHPSPYDDVLQRNMLLAAECLADDVQVKPDLRDEVLEKLATLLMHPAPQVRAAARARYEHLAKSRCCEPALTALKRVIVRQGDELNGLSFDATFGLASAAVSLGDTETAWPLMQTMERSEDWPEPLAQRLRFEGWAEHAVDYLLELYADKHSYFGIYAGPDLAHCTLGPVSAELALRVLGLSQLLALLQELKNRANDQDSRTILCWIAALTSEEPPIEVLVDLASPDVLAEVRCLAAIRLLETDRRAFAVEVLRGIVGAEHAQAPAAAQALLAAGETSQLNLSLIRDLAFLPDHEEAPQAIATLLQAGDEKCGLPAAFHFLAFGQTRYGNRGYRLWSVVESLLKYDRNKLGQAAARWLALRAEFADRYEACEALT